MLPVVKTLAITHALLLVAAAAAALLQILYSACVAVNSTALASRPELESHVQFITAVKA